MKSRFKETVITPILVIVIFALVLAVRLLPEETIGMNDNPYLAVVTIQLITYAVPALFYTRIRGRNLSDGLRIRLFPPSQILFLLQTAIFLICGTALISMLMYRVAPTAFEASALSEYAAFAMNSRFFDGVYLVVAFALLPAVTEEFVFRGIVIGEYQNSGVVLASVISAIMFAMSHFSLARFPVYFFAGLVLACVAFTTRSLIAAMLIHTLNNAFILLGEPYVLGVMDKQNVSLTLFVILLGGAALLSCTFMCFEANNIYRGYAKKNIPTDYTPVRRKGRMARWIAAFFAPTFLILVILYIIASLLKVS